MRWKYINEYVNRGKNLGETEIKWFWNGEYVYQINIPLYCTVINDLKLTRWSSFSYLNSIKLGPDL